MILVTAVVGSGIMATNLSADLGIQLLINSLATVFILIVLIKIFISISGSHFNPVVTLTNLILKRIKPLDAFWYIGFQTSGAILGSVIANLMFNLKPINISTTDRIGNNLLLAELIATAGLILIINLLIWQDSLNWIPPVVAFWIGSAYFFTSSTSFANPAVTIGRMFSDSFSGISPISVPPFLMSQIVGGILGLMLVKFLIINQDRYVKR